MASASTTEYSDKAARAGLCFSKQPPQHGHLSAVGQHDALPLSAGPGQDRDTNVREQDGSGTQTATHRRHSALSFASSLASS